MSAQLLLFKFHSFIQKTFLFALVFHRRGSGGDGLFTSSARLYLMFVIAGDDVGLERFASHQFGRRHETSQLLETARRVHPFRLILLGRAVHPGLLCRAVESVRR